MKSSKEKSAEEAYKKFLDIMLYDVPLKQLDDLVVNDVTGYGTTLDEKILEIERLRKLVIDQREQGAGYEMNFVINPVHRRINPDNGLAVFIDEIEISMNINGDKNIIPLRFSSVLELTNNSWKVVHLHGSVAVNTEGDTWHKEEHLRKIEELEKLVSEKTEDLLTKNRELEIEASLERVRTVAMGMNKSDDLLNICEVSFKEFKKIGFDNLRNAIIHILNDEKGFFLDYDYSDYLGGSINHINYNSHPVVEDYLRQIKKADDAFAQVVIEGTELDDWKEFRRSGGQVDDPKLDETQSLYYYLFSIGVGDIGISTFSPIDDTQIIILKRFRNVFDLTYRRYNDITLAEAQAREAQIELALERVRARTMAMQKSDELKEVIQLVYEQFVHLNVLVEHAGFIMDYKARDDMHIWLADKHEVPSEITIPYFDSPHWNSFIEAKEKGMDFFANHLDFEEKNKFYRDLFKLFPVADDAKKYYLSCPGLAISTVLLENIGLYIENFSGIPYTDEENNTLMRFGKVFQQTYTRFLDLQRAEAQAREAQIELALERVRARAMAMQKSDELLEVGALLYQGLFKLGIQNLTCGYVLMDQEKKIGWNYGVNPGDGTIKPQPTGIPQSGTKILQLITESWEKQEPFLLFKLDPQETINHQTYIAENCINFPFSAEKLLSISPERLVIHTFNFKQGYLLIVGGIVLTTQQQEMVIRFAKVFEQTYTRFLDLQKAETQARESQIELALERVRARTMAMQQSDELSETARVLFQQFKELGEDPDQLSIGIVNESEKVIEIWLSLQGNIMNRMFKAPIDEPTVINKIYTAWREKRKSVIIDISGDELERYKKYINSVVDFKEYKDVKNRIGRKEHRRIIYTSLFSKGLLSVATHEPRSEETIKILERFAGVFDGTYTRFLDLQKAEAQAREGQIQLALERVRAKAMAMHKSEDFAQSVFVVFEELESLNLGMLRCGIGIMNRLNRSGRVWTTVKTAEGGTAQVSGDESMEIHPMLNNAFEAWENGEDFDYTLEGDDLVTYYKALGTTNFKLPEFQKVKSLKKEYKQYYYQTPVKQVGGLFAFREFPFPVEAKQIMKRFAEVINLTYTRFHDLQKAETQAREVQIEAALERVRSRSIGMQKSEELREVIQVIHDQLILLNFEIDAAGFTLDYHQNNDWNTWIANKSESLPSLLFIPYIDHPQFNYYKSAKEKGLDFLANTLSFEEKNSIFNYMFEFMGDYPQAEKDELLGKPGLAISQAFLKNISLWIYNLDAIPYSEEDNSTLMRFAKVFEQTYTRFNDLKQAEAQTREVHIELSLERIRAQVTAMRESSELLDIVVTMRSEFVALGHEAHYFWHMRWLPDKYEKAMTSGDGARIGMVMTLPRHIHGDIKLVADWEKSDEPSVVLAMDVETAVNYVEKMITLGDFQQVDPQAPTLDDIRHIGGLTFIMARTTHGEIGFSLPGTVPNPPEESVTTLARFAGVFDLAYRRFEDLKEAEEKNKIIQADNERKTKELEDARQLQLSMLPKELPQLPNLDIAVYMKTATEVGGDYYDFNVDANGTLTVLVGDATGHGMMSGMMVSIMKSFFISNRSNIELKSFFENSNNSIKDMHLGRLMMASMGVQITSEKVIATNAGMPSLLYFRNKSQKAGEFVSNNLPLGGMKGTKYLLKAVRYEKGDTLLLMSDGFAELKNSQNEQFGYVRIKEIFRSLVQKSSSGIIEELKTAASQWTNEAEPDDDITFVVIKFK